MTETAVDYRRQMFLRALERQDDQIIGELASTKGGPVLNLLSQSRQDAAEAIEELIGLIRNCADPAGFKAPAQRVEMHFALMGYARKTHIVGKNAYDELKNEERLAISQSVVSNSGGDTTFADD